MGEPLSKQGKIIAHNADGQQGAGCRNKAGTEATARLRAGCPGVGRVTSTALVRAAGEELSPAGVHGLGHVPEPALLCALLPAQPSGGQGKKARNSSARGDGLGESLLPVGWEREW